MLSKVWNVAVLIISSASASLMCRLLGGEGGEGGKGGRGGGGFFIFLSFWGDAPSVVPGSVLLCRDGTRKEF